MRHMYFSDTATNTNCFSNDRLLKKQTKRNNPIPLEKNNHLNKVSFNCQSFSPALSKNICNLVWGCKILESGLLPLDNRFPIALRYNTFLLLLLFTSFYRNLLISARVRKLIKNKVDSQSWLSMKFFSKERIEHS